MFINRNNYEAILIDFLEGKLDDSLKAEVQQFLDSNPDIADEVLSVSETSVPGDETVIISKKSLIRSFDDIPEITESNYEEFCIAYYENDLSNAAQERFLNYTRKNPEKEEVFRMYKKIRFKADRSIHYREKSELLKPVSYSFRKTLYYAIPAAAAILLLLLSVPFGLKHKDTVKTMELTGQVSNIEEKAPVKMKSENKIQKISTEKKIIHAAPEEVSEQLAVFDTTDARKNAKVTLAALAPKKARIENSIQTEEINRIEIRQNSNNKPKQTEQELPVPVQKIPNIGIDDNKDIIWAALEFGFKGIGTLTESNLALHTETNEKGKLTEIKVKSDNFQFERKFKRNL